MCACAAQDVPKVGLTYQISEELPPVVREAIVDS
jgi:hypothetical protein